MKRGAFDYITKPFKNDEVLVVLRNAARAARACHARTAPSAEPADARSSKFANIIGRSRACGRCST